MWTTAKNFLRFTPLAAGGIVQFLDSVEPVLQILALIAGIILTVVSFMVQWEKLKLSRLETRQREQEMKDELSED